MYQSLVARHTSLAIGLRLFAVRFQTEVLNVRVGQTGPRMEDRFQSDYADGGHFPPDVLATALRAETPRTGLWLDTSAMSVDSVVEEILKAW